MAQRRMMSYSIIESDDFATITITAQALYLHIIMNCDDDGVCICGKRIMAFIGSTEKDLQELIDREYLLKADNGVLVVKHWWVHNLKRKDRYKPSKYFNKLNIELDEFDTYRFIVATKSQPNDNQMDTQYNINENKLNESNVNEYNINENNELDEIEEDNNSVLEKLPFE